MPEAPAAPASPQVVPDDLQEVVLPEAPMVAAPPLPEPPGAAPPLPKPMGPAHPGAALPPPVFRGTISQLDTPAPPKDAAPRSPVPTGTTSQLDTAAPPKDEPPPPPAVPTGTTSQLDTAAPPKDKPPPLVSSLDSDSLSETEVRGCPEMAWRREGMPAQSVVSKSGDTFISVVVSRSAATDNMLMALGLRAVALDRLGLQHDDYLPLAQQQSVENDYRTAWNKEDDQKARVTYLVEDLGLKGEQMRRTRDSDFNVALYERFGGRVWFKLLVATGDVTAELLNSVNGHNAKIIRAAGREPTPSRIGGARLSARNLAKLQGEGYIPPPTGVQHKQSTAKILRRQAKDLDFEIKDELRLWRQCRSRMAWWQWEDLLWRREADI